MLQSLLAGGLSNLPGHNDKGASHYFMFFSILLPDFLFAIFVDTSKAIFRFDGYHYSFDFTKIK